MHTTECCPRCGLMFAGGTDPDAAFMAAVREFLQSFEGSRPQDVIGQDSHDLYVKLAGMLPPETAS